MHGFHKILRETKDNRPSAHVGVPNKRNNQNSFVKSTSTWPPWRQVKTSNWHNLSHSKVNGDLSQDRHTHINTQKSPRDYGLMFLSQKTQKSNHLQILEWRQHLLLNYFKILSVSSAGNGTQVFRTIDWHLKTRLTRRHWFKVYLKLKLRLIIITKLLFYQTKSYIWKIKPSLQRTENPNLQRQPIRHGLC